ncbi:MAG: FecR domain-containing protein [Deltaproteobacteria bacterium]|nr:FecR domain-containing protein [Deltaproteobacteria bacterium]
MTDDLHLGPPPVEPMSDVAWARVERGLWSRVESGATDVLPAASAGRWLWIALPALSIAAVVALLLATGVLGSRGDLPVVSASETMEPSRVVASAAPSTVSFGDAHIDLAAQSAIVMSREGGSPSVLLERGVATFAVAPRVDRPPFVVRAGDTVVRVVGTRFTVSRSNEQITVAVDQGLVDVQFRGATQRVGAGHTWSSEAPDKVALHTPLPVTNLSGAPDSTTPDSITPDTRTTTPDTRTTTPDKRTTTPAITTTSPATATTSTDIRSGVRAPSTPKEADRAMFDRLTALERRDSKAALTGYLELSRGNSQWSEVALYAAGRLATDLGDRRAATFLDIYLRRFPNGANADDARNLLARLKGDAP